MHNIQDLAHDFSDIEQFFQTYGDGQTLYVTFERGAVHSVSRDHFVNFVIEWDRTPRGTWPAREPSGAYRLVLGYEVIDEDQARQSNPGLFGAPDPLVLTQMSRDDKRRWIEDQKTKRELEEQFQKELKAVGHL